MGGALVLAGIVAGIHVSGDIHCPELAEVEQRLASLLPAPDGESIDRAVIAQENGRISVELRRSDGTLVGSRVLVAKPSCEDNAVAVAVTIAAWAAQLRAGDPLRLPVHERVVVAVERPMRRDVLAWEVAASFLGSVAGSAFAPGGAGELFLGKKGFRVGARLGLAGTGTREIALGGGRAAYSRMAVVLGPTVEALAKVVRIEVHADVLAGWLFLEGQGFAANRRVASFDPGLGAGVRVALARWPVAPWIDFAVVGWLMNQTASATEGESRSSVGVPRLDVWARVGIAYGRRH